MSSAVAPRPCSITTTARASLRGAPAATIVTALSGIPLPLGQIRQHRLQLLATRFQEPRELEASPKTVNRLVTSDTGLVGPNREQPTTRFAEVNTAATLTILSARVVQS